MYTLSTLYQYRRQKNEDFRRSTQLRSRSKKNGRREKIFQNKCALVPKTNSMRKEEGATVAATPTFPHSGQSRLSLGRTGGVSTETLLYRKAP